MQVGSSGLQRKSHEHAHPSVKRGSQRGSATHAQYSRLAQGPVVDEGSLGGMGWTGIVSRGGGDGAAARGPPHATTSAAR